MLNQICNFLSDLFDPHKEIRRLAADRNWHLIDCYDGCWAILEASGKCVAAGTSPREAYLEAIYRPCQTCV